VAFGVSIAALFFKLIIIIFAPLKMGAKEMLPLPSGFATIVSVLTYSLCSGLLLLMNKVVLTFIPSTPLVVTFQCVFCIAAIVLCHGACGVPKLSEMTRPVLYAYAQYGVLFVGGIYTNMRALESSNVDTVIVFRSASPLVVALGDYILLGRSAPSLRSFLSMLLVFVGCASFVLVDAEYKMKGLWAYGWCGAYLFFISAEMLLGKQITAAHQASLGTSVLMTNSFGVLPFIMIGASTGELATGMHVEFFTPGAIAALVFSCALSAGIGFSSWWCRGLVSATSFTVIGTVNKVSGEDGLQNFLRARSFVSRLCGPSTR
jgi:drug/metabolite transporter (DMT)-like permease